MKAFVVGMCTILAVSGSAAAELPLELGSKREPFVDRYLIDTLDRAELRLGVPNRENIALRFDEPWEGTFSGYITVIKDGSRYRMYYRGRPTDKLEYVTCYAESSDGLHWSKPALSLHSYGERLTTNIVLKGGSVSSNFSPFLDANPKTKPDERFKAVGGDNFTGLFALVSADGIEWRLMQPEPVFRSGAFDSQNVPFWSDAEGCYVLYFRVFTEGNAEKNIFEGIRTIARTTSQDFIHWSPPVRMVFGETAMEHLYTNQTHPYYRAPHIYLSFPMRLVPERRLLDSAEARKLGVFEDRENHISDGVFMTTRGGNSYERTFLTALFRPGPDPNMWVARNCMAALGVVPLGNNRMAIYLQHHYASLSNHLVTYSLREDGLASVHGGDQKGVMVTKGFRHAGNGLWLNFATSAVGTLTVEILDVDGKPIPGFSEENQARLFGDSLEQEVSWEGHDWRELLGRPIRVRFTLQDADLYSLRQR